MLGAAARFSGLASEPRVGMRSGHIPGTVSVPYTALPCPDGTLRSPEELRARFLTLGMCLVGLPQGALYDGSWSEWGGRHETPVDRDWLPSAL